MPSSLVDVVQGEVGDANVSQQTNPNRREVNEGATNGYGVEAEVYGNKVVDNSDLATQSNLFTAYQKSFIRNRLSSNPANLRAIIDIFRKFAVADIDSMISEVYPGSLWNLVILRSWLKRQKSD